MSAFRIRIRTLANPLMTTRLDDDLPKCGKSCCPHGYSCEDNKTCRRKTSTSTTSSQSSTSTETSPTQTTSSITTTAAQEVTATATSTIFLFPTPGTEASSLEQDCPSFPGRAIAAGFFPGLITGALIALITIICIGQRRRKQAAQHAYASKTTHMRKRSSDGAIIGISDPMPGEIQNSVRTDFLRQTPSYDGGASTNDTKSRFYRTGSRVKSLFNGSPKSTYSRREYRTSTPPPPIPPIYRPTPATPPDQIHPQRQPSTESIKVYSPEHIVRGHGSIRPDWMRPPNFGNNNTRPNTTFTEMMERVGFQGSNGDPHFKVTVTPPTQYPGDSAR
ncbi:hypothetical protein FQN54_003805 [Arachnomyces sp. PD_36]|nr:hypothetical protein FQN54_003805 [Arachnomyces sp. PD_36]